jgi:hypothetical protein
MKLPTETPIPFQSQSVNYFAVNYILQKNFKKALCFKMCGNLTDGVRVSVWRESVSDGLKLAQSDIPTFRQILGLRHARTGRANLTEGGCLNCL